jgi:hypothetical protein
LALITGSVAYFNYREKIRKDFLRSEGHYRFSHLTENITPWKQLYWTWWRMPEEEFNVYHRFKPYYMLGQLDYTKEILIPKKNAWGQDGYDVINPLYCYEGGKVSMKELMNGGDSIKIERSAIIVNRGWIPAHLSDKRQRPTEVNSRQLVKIRGVFRAGKDIHDYKYPNNPDNNEWHNLALEDIGIFWDLPNWDEAKYYYFQVIDMGDGKNGENFQAEYVKPLTKDEVIEEHYGWRWNEGTHGLIQKTFGAATAGLLAIGYWAM